MKCCEFRFVVTSEKMNAAKCCYLPSSMMMTSGWKYYALFDSN